MMGMSMGLAAMSMQWLPVLALQHHMHMLSFVERTKRARVVTMAGRLDLYGASLNIAVPTGPFSMCVKSTTRIPENGPDVLSVRALTFA